MSVDAALIYPNQLFEDHPALKKGRIVYLIEDPLFFKQYSFHKKKLIFHRASMKYYQDFLTKQGYEVQYIDSKLLSKTSKIVDFLKENKISKVHFSDLDDDWLSKKLLSACKKNKISVQSHSSPGFITTLDDSLEFLKSKKNYFQTSFYIWQRKNLDILIEKHKPTGGSWTFDKENRKKLPKDISVPRVSFPKDNKYIKNAKIYITKHFSKNPGDNLEANYPVTHKDAKKWLENFIERKLETFGPYQDSISSDNSFLFHSLLSPLINVGLITPRQILDAILEKHAENPIPLNSLEGFIRQVIGWREFFRAVYALESVNQRTKNFFGFERDIPSSFWSGTTGIEPIDIIIKRVLEDSYAHHIERLMVLGNFMLLCRFHPDQVYRWFMELFIDAYDWVMVPNVYGMSQYADGGLITTKPYISSSNYIKKMSDFKSGEWCEIWDGLYWSFIDKQKKHFKNNNRMSLMLKQLEKMDQDKLKKHKKISSSYLKSL